MCNPGIHISENTPVMFFFERDDMFILRFINAYAEIKGHVFVCLETGIYPAAPAFDTSAILDIITLADAAQALVEGMQSD